MQGLIVDTGKSAVTKRWKKEKFSKFVTEQDSNHYYMYCYHGVPNVARLCVMNLYLHGIGSEESP